MSVFPKIQSPCPVRGNIKAYMAGDTCRLCQRTVTDLTAMTDDQRKAFIAGCETEVCVSYTLPVKRAVAAAMMTASLVALPAAAEDMAGASDPTCVENIEVGEDYDEYVLVGGISSRRLTEWQEPIKIILADDIEAVPVVYEDEEAESSEADTAQEG